MNRQSFKNWENIEGEGETESKSGASPAMLRLPYALAKEKGLNTDGMTPRQVWDMLKGKGVDKAAEEKKFIASQKGGKQPQEQPKQSSEAEDIDKLRQELREEVLLSYEKNNPPQRINSAKTLASRQSEIDKHMEFTDILLSRENDAAKMKEKIERYRESRKQIEPTRKPPIELPTLSGSEKQVAWADDIRYKMARALEGLTELLHDNPRAMEAALQTIKERKVHAGFRSRTYQVPDFEMAIAILKETDARWFIDNR